MPDFQSVGDARDYCIALEGVQQPRFTKYKTMERLYRLEKYVLEETRNLSAAQRDDWPTFTSNAPRTLYNALWRAVNKNDPLHRIDIPTDADRQEQDKIAAHEYLVVGALEEVDELRQLQDLGPFQSDATHFFAVRGGLFARVILEPGRPHTMFNVTLWDPSECVYEPGYAGLAYVARHYYAPAGQVQARYDKAVERDADGNTEVFDIWWYCSKGIVWNAVCTRRLELKPMSEEKFDRIPIRVVRRGPPTMPTPGSPDATGAQQQRWVTIYDANAETYAWLNRAATLFGLYLRSGAIGPYHAHNVRLPDDQLKNALRPFAIISTEGKEPAGVQPVSPPLMAVEAKEFAALVEAEAQRGGVPHSTFGQIPFELSGFGISQLQAGIEVSALPLSQCLVNLYTFVDDEILNQFARLDGRFSTTVKGIDRRSRRFMERIRPTDVREKYILRIELPVALPEDDLKRAQVAQVWRQLGASELTVFDQVLRLADPSGEYKRKLQELVDMLGIQAALGAGRQQAGRARQPSPEVQPPEERGILAQHEEFQPGPQHIGLEERAAAAGLTVARS